LIVANWDYKADNNRIYRVKPPIGDASRLFVVQDLGASLGKWRVFPFLVGTRNDVEDFESTPLIKEVRGNEVRLNYRGRHGEIFSVLSVADVKFACELMNRLRDSQLDDAFEAAGYPADVRTRYIKKIREKIDEGLSLSRTASAQAGAHP
jgi:hypothetical protein